MLPVPDLGSVLGPIRWALVGGVALRAYMPERTTLYVALVTHKRDGAAARKAFLDAGYEIIGDLSIGGFTARRPAPEATPVDVLTRDDPWLDGALDNPGRDAAGFPVLARPYLTLLKLRAGRTRDLADVQRLLAGTPASERGSTRKLVRRHAPELVEDYDALATLADLEFGDPEP